ncbi:hypothetical protein QTO34_016826 [Cnephaeus nilssonii]|uniref:Uncharacterized protein n=1 Tax=Cnephaeus nilssonii TaxID=3371016 RepID=A0AA40LS87_CNENI|nr:hypothetical protein QTO34_016826 [Eptesicus nilssonii]
MVNLTEYLSELNVKLQGPNQLLSSLLSNVKSFEAKLRLWEVQLKRNNTVHFPTLEGQKPPTTLECAGEWGKLTEAFNERFKDKLPLVVSAIQQGEHHSARSRAHGWRAQLPQWEPLPTLQQHYQVAAEGSAGKDECEWHSARPRFGLLPGHLLLGALLHPQGIFNCRFRQSDIPREVLDCKRDVRLSA